MILQNNPKYFKAIIAKTFDLAIMENSLTLTVLMMVVAGLGFL